MFQAGAQGDEVDGGRFQSGQGPVNGGIADAVDDGLKTGGNDLEDSVAREGGVFVVLTAMARGVVVVFGEESGVSAEGAVGKKLDAASPEPWVARGRQETFFAGAEPGVVIGDEVDAKREASLVAKEAIGEDVLVVCHFVDGGDAEGEGFAGGAQDVGGAIFWGSAENGASGIQLGFFEESSREMSGVKAEFSEGGFVEHSDVAIHAQKKDGMVGAKGSQS